MANKIENVKMVLKNVRLYWPCLTKEQVEESKFSEDYNAKFHIAPDDTAMRTLLDQCTRKAEEEARRCLDSNLKNFARNIKVLDDKTLVINGKSKFAIPVYDGSKHELSPEEIGTLGNGTVVNAVLMVRPYEYMGKYGCSFYLNALQIVKAVHRGFDFSSDFDCIEGGSTEETQNADEAQRKCDAVFADCEDCGNADIPF